MKNIFKILFLVVVLSYSVNSAKGEIKKVELESATTGYKYGGYIKYSVENSIRQTILTPKGYERIKLHKNSFAEWMRYLPVKPIDSPVLYYTGDKVPDGYYKVLRVIDLPFCSKRNIEQCADWGYRFWYEYQKAAGVGEDLWMTDYNGNKRIYKKWKKGRKKSSLEDFFLWVCNYANSYSQKMGLYEVAEPKLRPGDLIVQNQTGRIGHVSVIFDICENKKGEKLYLVGYSFMPAQECHIEKADDEPGVDGWFTLEGYYQHTAGFGQIVLRSFIEQE